MKRKKQVRKPKFPTVAVVLKRGANSGRPLGDWGCFVGAEKDETIATAMRAKAQWERNGYGPYEIAVGTLTELIVLPTNYKVIKLSATPVPSSQGKR